MKSYRLYVEDLSGVWHSLDMDERPYINKQSNNIGELVDRQADYSLALSLPLTPTNINFFSFIDRLDYNSTMPYHKLNVRLFFGDSLLFPVGSKLIILSYTNKIKVQILGSNLGFVSQLKELQISDIIDREIDLDTVNLESTATDYFFGASSNFEGYEGDNPELIRRLGLIPYISIDNLFDLMFTELGYSWSSNVSGALAQYAIGYSKRTRLDADQYNSWFDNSQTGIAINDFMDASEILTDDYTDPNGRLGYFGAWFIYTPIKQGKVTYSVQLSNTTIQDCDLRIEVYNGSTSTEIYDATDFDHDVSGSIVLKYGEYIRIYAKNTSLSVLDMNLVADFQFEYTDENTYSLNSDHKFNLNQSFPFDSLYECFKTLLQYFGLTIVVDERLKVISLNTISKLYTNKTTAIDWSDKLAADQKELYYKVGEYGQINNVSLKENTKDNYTDSISFSIDDETLKAEVDVLNIAIESGVNRLVKSSSGVVQYQTVANIPVLKIDDSGNISFQHTDAHIVNKASGTSTYPVYNNAATSYVDYDLTSVIHFSYQSVFGAFYLNFLSLVQNAKKIVHKFNLNEQDIENFDQFTPIYLRQYGKYFYVNKITNWTEGKLTEVELYKM